MTEETDTREKMAELNARRDAIRAEIDAGSPRTRLDGNGDVVAAPRADGHSTHVTVRASIHDGEVFAVKDSGVREQFESGMVRDTAEGKVDYSLVFDGPMFERWAEHMTKGAEKYAKRNWMQAMGEAELERFRESAIRHFLQWYRGDTDEDHAAAVIFNINGAEYVKARATAETEIEGHARS